MPGGYSWKRHGPRRRAFGPLRAFFLRIRSRRGQHVAAVATARKLAVLIWHLLTKEHVYLWGRPALHAAKLRRLELTAGQAPARGQRGRAYDYNIKAVREYERQEVGQAEKLYARFVAGWNPRGPKARMSAASGGPTTEAAQQGPHLQPCSPSLVASSLSKVISSTRRPADDTVLEIPAAIPTFPP
jgi:hypothetical protein